MSYPPAPWTLQGFAYQTVQLIDYSVATQHVPIGLEIVSVAPGKTLGGLYFAQYGDGSTLPYNELIVVAAICGRKRSDRSGQLSDLLPRPWISHIYVDHPDSVQGGREIWSLPKELAQFDWIPGKGVAVSQNDRLLCELLLNDRASQRNSYWNFPSLTQHAQAAVYSQSDEYLMRFEAIGSASVSLVSSRLHVPAFSPFARLVQSSPIATVKADDLIVTVTAPQPIGPSTAIRAATKKEEQATIG